MKDRNPAADLPAEPKCYVKVVSLLLYFFFLGSATTHAFIKHVCSLTKAQVYLDKKILFVKIGCVVLVLHMI